MTMSFDRPTTRTYPSPSIVARSPVLDVQRVRADARALLDEAEQQPEGVAVGGDRVRAGLALADKPPGEERLHRRGQRTHRTALRARAARRRRARSPVANRNARSRAPRPSPRRSRRSAARPSSSGAADRYQYVAAGSTCPREVDSSGSLA